MNTREIAAEYRLGHWAQIMRERRESGLSIKAFCKQSGFHENVYYYWQRKLREEACERMSGETTSLTVPGFAAVQLTEKTSASGDSGQLCISVDGVQITADSNYPPEKLAALLREVKRSC